MACGHKHDALVIQRWHDDGSLDRTFAAATDGQVRLAVDDRPDLLWPQFSAWRTPRCSKILQGAAGDHIVIGELHKPREIGGGRILARPPRTRQGRSTPASIAQVVAASSHWAPGSVVQLARRRCSSNAGRRRSIYRAAVERTDLLLSTTGPATNALSLPASRSRHHRIALDRSASTKQECALRSGIPPICACIVPEARREPFRSATRSCTARADTTDVMTTAGRLTWADGDTSAQTIRLAPVDDMLLEGEERFRIRLRDPTGGAGTRRSRDRRDDRGRRSVAWTAVRPAGAANHGSRVGQRHDRAATRRHLGRSSCTTSSRPPSIPMAHQRRAAKHAPQEGQRLCRRAAVEQRRHVEPHAANGDVQG